MSRSSGRGQICPAASHSELCRDFRVKLSGNIFHAGIGIAIAIYNRMNASNPFQIPPCLQRADVQQRRRERFRNGFLAAVAAHVILFAVLLIQGCKNGQSAFNAKPEAPPAIAAAQPSPSPATTKPAPVVVAPVQTVAKEIVSAPVNHVETVYQVKSGDTLSRVAKIHNSTVKAIKSANSLSDERLVVGAKLKIPAA
ncbi:MAG: LysM domain [Verrucomicrobiota bacterium]